MRHIIFTLLFLCTSCAKMINGSHQTVHVDNLPKDAVVIVSDSKGSKIANNPKLKLARSSPYTVEIRRPGFTSKKVEITRSLSPLVLSYALPGGLAMLAIDSTTSSQFNLEPSRVNAGLKSRMHGPQTIFDHREDMNTAALVAYRAVIRAVIS